MKKILLLLTLLLSLIGGARAQGPTTWDELWTSLQTSGTVTLTQDITRTGSDTHNYLEVPSGVTVTLDLNGHIIDRALTAATADGYVLKVSGTLTINDSSNPSTGGITGGWNSSGYGGGVNIAHNTNAQLILNNGKIYGNKVEKTSGEARGGGIFIGLGAIFTMNGGTITGNSTITTTESMGGGVYVHTYNGKYGTFNMNGGTITGNSIIGNVNVTGYLVQGGGVYISHSPAGKFNLSGKCTITGNTATDTGTQSEQNVYVSSGTVIDIAGALNASTRIGVTAPVNNIVTSGLSGNGELYNFTSDDSNFALILSGTEVKVVESTNPTIASVPYAYDFETAGPFGNWTSLAGVSIEESTTDAHESSKYLNFYGTTNNLVALPQFDVAINTLLLEFWTRPDDYAHYYCGYFEVGYMTDPADVNTFVVVETYDYSDWASNTYEKKTVDFFSAPANAYIAMRHCPDMAIGGWCVDDVIVKTLQVANLAVNSTTATSAELSWIENGTATDWVLQYGTDETFADGTYSEVNVSGTPSANLTGLTPETTYYARVRSINYNEWSNTVSFTPSYKTVIGSGTNTDSYLPSYTYYNYALTQQIYTTAELGQAGLIECIDFYSTATERTRNLDIYMVSTDKDEFTSTTDWIPVTDADLVFSGNVTFAQNAWTSITLDDAFIYDGTNNVAIIVDDNTGSYVSSPYFLVFPTANNKAQAIYYYNDNNNYDPTGTPGTASNTLNKKNQLRILKSALGNCMKPTNFTATEVRSNFAILNWTENATATEWVIDYNGTTVNVTEKPYTLTGLTPETEYTVKVRPACDDNLWSSAITFTTLAACPAPDNVAVSNIKSTTATVSWTGYSDSYKVNYRTAAYVDGLTEEFGSSIPTGWTQKTGLLSNVMNGSALTSSSYGWSFGTANGVFDDHARVNIYGNGKYVWLITPGITLPTGAGLSFDLALTAYSGTNVPAPATNGDDDKFVVLISTDNMETWTILREWNNSGSTYVYNDIANSATGENVAIDLSSYAGQDINIAFYGESTTQNADNNLHIDNVAIGTAIAAGTWQTTNTDDMTANLTGLAAETIYEVKVEGSCGGSTSLPSASVFFTTLVARPAPTELTWDESTTTTAKLHWTENGTASAWQICLNDDENNLIDVDTNPCTLAVLTASSVYTAKVRANYGIDGTSAWSTPISFATKCGAITTFPWSEDFDNYSTGDFTNPCWENEHIEGNGNKIFTISTTTNGTNSTHQLQLPDQSDGTVTVLVLPEMTLPNDKYQFTLDVYRNNTYSNKTDEGIRVFASTDGDISGAIELAFIPRVRTVENAVIPAETTDGWYTYELPIGFSGTCYIILRGESKYGAATNMDNFVVEEVPTCVKPIGLKCVSSTTTEATLTWTNGTTTQTAWQIAYSNDPSFDPNTVTPIDVTSNPASITGLASSTIYYAYVRANCGNGDYSNWCNNYCTFATDCESIDLSLVDYSENFDNYTGVTSATANNLPLCWNYINTCTDNYYNGYPVVYNSSNYSHSGNNSLRFYSYYSSNNLSYDPQDQYAILPPMDNLAGKQITLWAKGYNSTSSFKVGTMTDPTDATTFEEIDEHMFGPNDYNTYQELTFNIPANASGNYVAIMINAATSGRPSNGVYIDDITIADIPTCVKPSGLEWVSSTTTEATLTWTPSGGETEWQLCINGDETHLINVLASDLENGSYTLRNLSPSTTYTAKIRAYCDDNNQSGWSSVISFATECDVIVVDMAHPYTEGFEGTWTPQCWVSIDSSNHQWTKNANYYHSGSASAYSGYYGDIYLVMPDIQLGTDGDKAQLTFWNLNRYINDFQVGNNSVVLLDGNGETVLWEPTEVTQTWEEVTIDLTSYMGQTISIAFKYAGNNGNAYYIDDVQVVLLTNITLADDDSQKPVDDKNTAILNTYDGQLANVTLQGRTLWKDGAWNTLCLPFDLTLSGSVLDGADVRELTSATITNGTLRLGFTTEGTVTELTAGTPYIIKWASGENLVNPLFENVTVTSATNDFVSGGVTFKGTYEPITFDTENHNILFMGESNTLYWPQSGAYINAFRAYFQLADGSSANNFVLTFDDDDPTAIQSLESRVKSLESDVYYDLQGRKISNFKSQISNLPKGIYINNGKKIIIK